MTALSVETLSIITSVTTAGSDVAVSAALAFAIVGVIANVLVIALLNRQRLGRHAGVISRQMHGWAVGVGALLPVLALVCLFVGTQSVATIAATGAISALVIVAVAVVLWFD